MNQEYQHILEAMYGLRRFGIKLGLSVIRNMLRGLGNPQKRFRSIHVAGTNGKGSVASAMACILQKSGFEVGLYTSPHLVTFNERIRVNGEMISDKETVEAYRAVQGAYSGSREPTFFEVTTAMAIYEFARRKVDWAVVETGMGGRLDATNVLRPDLSIITNIALEHREYLGHRISDIAFEKAGIIKHATPVVTGVRQQSARDVVARVSKEKSAPCFQFRRDFRVRKNDHGSFAYHGLDTVWRDLRTGLAGNYQLGNAALILAACEIIKRNGVDLPEEAIRRGLAENRWPGRLETVSTNPTLLLDGAHNLIAARHLARYLQAHFRREKTTLVVGILDDKPAAAMLRALAPQCTRLVATRPQIDRGLPAATVAAMAKKWVDDVVVIPTVAEALRHALGRAREDEIVCVAGSLYVVGEAKAALTSTTAVAV